MEELLSNLSQALVGKVYHHDDLQYTESLTSYFSAQESQIRPACIVRPQSAADVATAVSLLVQANQREGIGSAKFAIRSGGHTCFAGSANEPDGITIDLRDLNTIEVDKNSSSPQVAIGSGASWCDVYRALDPLGLGVPGGRHSQVGVGGLTLGGGLSHFSGRVGLVCDNVVEYEIVLASGDIIRASETEHQDLLRALRGGSNNFGIVTRFVFRTIPLSQLWGGTLIQPLETKGQQLQAFHDFVANPSYDAHASLIHSFGMSAERGSGFVNSIVYTKPESEPAVIKPFTSIEPAYVNTLRELSLTELTREQDAFNENGLCQVMIATTFFLSLPLLHRTFDLWQASCDTVRDRAGIIWSMSFQPIAPLVVSHSPFLQSVLGEAPKPIVIAQLTGTWTEARDSHELEATALKLVADIDAAAAGAQPSAHTGYLYLNYAHPSQSVFGTGERREWLRGVSRRYDPDAVFQRCVLGGFKLW